MLWNILGAAAVAALVLLLIWALRGLMLTPVRPGSNTSLTVRLDISGAEPCLEGTVAALEWLEANGTLPCRIELRDLGMDENTRLLAEALAREGRVDLAGDASVEGAHRRTEEGD